MTNEPLLTDKELSVILSIISGDRPFGLDADEKELVRSAKEKIRQHFHGPKVASVPVPPANKKTKRLKLFNGRAFWMRRYRDPLWANIRDNESVTGYVAAYNVEDARRVIEEYTGTKPSRSEICTYWHHGCWGNSMTGITPERGLWLVFGHSRKPVRVV